MVTNYILLTRWYLCYSRLFFVCRIQFLLLPSAAKLNKNRSRRWLYHVLFPGPWRHVLALPFVCLWHPPLFFCYSLRVPLCGCEISVMVKCVARCIFTANWEWKKIKGHWGDGKSSSEMRAPGERAAGAMNEPGWNPQVSCGHQRHLLNP